MAVLSGSISDNGRDVVEPDRQPPDPKEKQVPASVVVDLLDSPPPRSNPAVVLVAPGAPPPPAAAATTSPPPPVAATPPPPPVRARQAVPITKGSGVKGYKKNGRSPQSPTSRPQIRSGKGIRNLLNSNLGEAGCAAASSSAASDAGSKIAVADTIFYVTIGLRKLTVADTCDISNFPNSSGGQTDISGVRHLREDSSGVHM
ncbi:hypothetical protein EJB05_25690 [Eragrostis curvula]|uniref:Uncharacterized protein n=1 Tax=Eragrostis curvula TaxID=38414 RepID=A0A5J9UHV2_9POAL|nr:hypothetical protein EJB05_25690 [Eragrostis curvula]